MKLLAILSLVILQDALPEVLSGELQLDTTGAEVFEIVSSVRGDAWVGYFVPAVDGRSHGCGDVLYLEEGHGYREGRDEVSRSDTRRMVLIRVDDGEAVDVRTVSSGCTLDSGGVRVVWLPSVSVDDSLSALDRLLRASPRSELAEDAVHAVAQHRGEAADARLVDYVDAALPDDVREKAVFWMGASRGVAGLESLNALSRQDDVMRSIGEKVVFAFHVSDAPEATTRLIELARAGRTTDVREKALFWLAQEAGTRAAATIADAVRADPELEVKEKAVFALSQLPPEEGVPLLIEVAESHPSPEVRKKAFFWLGQSGEPDALALIERVLGTGR